MTAPLQEPKTVIDSVGDGAVELLQTGARVTDKSADVAKAYARSLNAIAEDIKRRMPDDPPVLGDAIMKTAGATVKAVVGTVEAVVGGVGDTARGVKSQIERVIRR